MSHSDQVREHCRARYVAPARSRGEDTVVIRVGDVHTALGFKNRLPLVCSALGGRTFEEMCHLERVAVDGPLNSTTTTLTFRIL